MADSNESVLAWAAAMLAKQAKDVGRAFKDDMTHGSGPAIGRELINDVRGTMHQVFFNQGESNGEPGTPMSPLPSEVAEQKKGGDAPSKGHDAKDLYGKGAKAGPAGRLPSPSEIARETKPYQPGTSQNAAIEPETWQDRILRERQKTDENATGQSERAKGRSLPDEQQQDKSRGR